MSTLTGCHRRSLWLNQILSIILRYFAVQVSGGKGSAHLRREKFIPKGGPDGGDGGRGGNIILRGNSQLWTLLHIRYRKHIFAGHGEDGQKANQTGADGEDVVIEVPLGTVARECGNKRFSFRDHTA